MATSAPRPIPVRPGQNMDQRRSSYPAFNVPQPQPNRSQAPAPRPEPTYRNGQGVPPPSAPPQSLPPPEYRMNYRSSPPQQDPYSSATSPGAGYGSYQPQQGYSTSAPKDFGFPQQGQPQSQSQYTPPNPSQYLSTSYAQPPPQQTQQSLHPQDAYARDAYEPTPPKQIEPAPAGRQRRGTYSAPDDNYLQPQQSRGRRRRGTYSAPDENYMPPQDSKPRRRRDTYSADDDYYNEPRPGRGRRMSYDPGDAYGRGVGPPTFIDFEDDFPPRRYSYEDDYDREDEMERRRRHEERKQEKRRRRQQSTSSKGSSAGDRPSHSFGDSVFWVVDSMKDRFG